MRRYYDPWTVLGVMAACAGIVAGITSLQFPGTFIGYWIAGGCLIAATSVLATKLGVWLIWNTNIRKILLWIPGAVSVAAALLYVLQAAGERQPQPDEPAAITQGASRSGTTETATIVEVRVPRVPIPETQPGFTRIVLMQIDRASIPGRQYAFNDLAPDGARMALFLEPDTISAGGGSGSHLTYAVTDTKGRTNRLQVPVGPGGIPADRNVFVTCVTGNTKQSSYMRVLADGLEVARQTFDTPLELGGRQWKPTTGAYQTNMRGLRASTQGMLAVPWALGDDKLRQVGADFKASHPGFFSGDDGYLYAPEAMDWQSAPPISGTFYYRPAQRAKP